ncbi:MAG: hypothetical protein AAF298_08085 [Cyanobacteria bacterium P01_A01_bin.40]
MDNCPICSSAFAGDIDKMISAGSNNKHVQQWCKERKFKLTLKAIENHRVNHLKYIEKVEQKLTKIEPIYLNIGEIEEQLDLPYECLLPYFSSNNIKVNKQQDYDVMNIIGYIARSLDDKRIELNQRLAEISNPCDKEVIRELKNQKVEAQTRLQIAVASLKEIKLSELQGELVSSKHLEEKWSYSLVGFKAKLESMPNKVALQLSDITNQEDIQNILDKLISESLEELQHGS